MMSWCELTLFNDLFRWTDIKKTIALLLLSLLLSCAEDGGALLQEKNDIQPVPGINDDIDEPSPDQGESDYISELMTKVAGDINHYTQNVHTPIVVDLCLDCHVTGSDAGNTALVFTDFSIAGAEKNNPAVVSSATKSTDNSVAAEEVKIASYKETLDRYGSDNTKKELLLNKPVGLSGHGGGVIIQKESVLHLDLQAYINTIETTVVEVLTPKDTDNDGIEDFVDTDDDNDGVADVDDGFPKDNSESTDSDGDGEGNNADEDDDNDGVVDVYDEFPFKATESVDTDGDGLGNNEDSDDDNDGIADGDDNDPLNVSLLDTDNDGVINPEDTDDDNDGVEDDQDAFPLDESESLDTDLDGIGNNTDNDDDGDGVNDNLDLFPLDNAETSDTDADGLGNNSDSDDDNDGVDDIYDAFVLDAAESVDTDGDGIGNNADTDDDNDEALDEYDDYPLDGTRSADFDADFNTAVHQPIIASICLSCHTASGNAGVSGLIFRSRKSQQDIDINKILLFEYVVDSHSSNHLLSKINGEIAHGGGVVLEKTSVKYSTLEEYLTEYLLNGF
jgi:hypothetical protein